MSNPRSKLLTSGLLLVPLVAGVVIGATLKAKHAPTGAQDGEEEMPGALDPNIPEVLATGPAPINQKASLDGIVGDNVLVNSRDRCPSGQGNIQNETSIAADGQYVLVAYNNSRGRCDPPYSVLGFSYSLDYGATFTQGTGLPRGAQLNNGDPWLGMSSRDPVSGLRTFYMAGLYNGYNGFGF